MRKATQRLDSNPCTLHRSVVANMCRLAMFMTCFATGSQASDFVTMSFIGAALRFQASTAPVSAFICWEPGNGAKTL
jgi:hypothetical protein